MRYRVNPKPHTRAHSNALPRDKRLKEYTKQSVVLKEAILSEKETLYNKLREMLASYGIEDNTYNHSESHLDSMRAKIMSQRRKGVIQ